MNLELKRDELYEINDAIGEVIARMLRDGQTKQEIGYSSLRVLWEVKKKVTFAVLEEENSPGILEQEPKILRAMQCPKILDREHGYLGGAQKFGVKNAL